MKKGKNQWNKIKPKNEKRVSFRDLEEMEEKPKGELQMAKVSNKIEDDNRKSRKKAKTGKNDRKKYPAQYQ